MVNSISGKISEITPTQVVVENNGIGYIAEISLQTYSALESKSEATIYFQQQINQRDGTAIDYGFASKAERDLFRLITSVSGMGASSARMILSTYSSEEFCNAILSEDINKIKAVKGLGLKSAQRLILELKDKLVRGDGSSESALFRNDFSEYAEEASQALILLGFSKPNVSKAVQSILKANPQFKVEEIIKAALKIL